MKYSETAALIKICYDAKLNGIEKEIYTMIDYLTRRDYFKNGRPTLKAFRLLEKEAVYIEQIKEAQEEYRKTGKVTY